LPRPVPAWDITDDEISEWQHSRCGIPGRVLAGYTAAAIKNGTYEAGQELFPSDSAAYRDITRQTIDKGMEMLAERGMVRKSGTAWYPVTPGRIAPSARRAVTILLASRDELPPALATELDSYQASPGHHSPGRPRCQARQPGSYREGDQARAASPGHRGRLR
jgi:hypothetical protein